MNVLERPSDNSSWTRRWFVVRRPFLYVYTDRSETDELTVISLDDVKTQWHLEELEALFDVSFVRAPKPI